MQSEKTARVIAFYLPQFHPIPENDLWWGKGFTEWTNVTRAQPLFRGHYQPRLPADLGYYDLRVPEVREAQAEMAREHGIEGFCYWHYWFAGDRLLERPFQEVLDTGKPDFPFCLAWANHSWSGIWSGGDSDRIIKEQTYPGTEDLKRHFDYLLKAFSDRRYITVDGKPLFVIFAPREIPNCRRALDYCRELAGKAGLPGLHLVANLDYHEKNWDATANGFDAVTIWPITRVIQSPPYFFATRLKLRLKMRLSRRPRLQRLVDRLWPGPERIYDYAEILPLLGFPAGLDSLCYPTVTPNWDTTPRYGNKAIVFHNSTPQLFATHVREVLDALRDRADEHRLVFIKSWNEWAEGNYMEPDSRYGRGYLQALRDVLFAESRLPPDQVTACV